MAGETDGESYSVLVHFRRRLGGIAMAFWSRMEQNFKDNMLG